MANKSLVEQKFGANAAAYATSAIHAKGASLSRVVELVAPRPDWAALDVATGAGHMAAAIAPYVGRVIAVDLTPEMLAEAAKLAQARGLANLETIRGSAQELPFADATFDVVTCRIAAHHFPDVSTFVAEVWRVLRPGAVFALVDNVAPGTEMLHGFAPSDILEAAATYNAFEKLRDPSHGRALSRGEWLKVLADGGFLVELTELMSKEMELKAWAERMSCDSDTVTALKVMLDDAAPALAAFLKPEVRGGLHYFTLTEAVILARKPL